jgi:hypothetical protein
MNLYTNLNLVVKSYESIMQFVALYVLAFNREHSYSTDTVEISEGQIPSGPRNTKSVTHSIINICETSMQSRQGIVSVMCHGNCHVVTCIKRIAPQVDSLFNRAPKADVKMAAFWSVCRSDGPKFITEISELTADNGAKEISISCEVDSNPTARYVWTRDSTRFPVLSRSATLTIGSLTEESFGLYTCTATVEGYQPISRAVHLLMNGECSQQSFVFRSDGRTQPQVALFYTCVLNHIRVQRQLFSADRKGTSSTHRREEWFFSRR